MLFRSKSRGASAARPRLYVFRGQGRPIRERTALPYRPVQGSVRLDAGAGHDIAPALGVPGDQVGEFPPAWT